MCVVAVVLLLVAPPAAQADLPVGEADGVRIVRERGAIVVVFTKPAERLYRRIAGKRVSVLCTERTSSDGGLVGVNTPGGTLRAPQRGRRLRTGDLTRGLDYCRVWLAPRTVKRNDRRVRLGLQLIVSIPLTQKGAVYLDEESKALDLIGLLIVAGTYARKPSRRPTPPQRSCSPLSRRTADGPRASWWPLPVRPDTPPAGSIGYYSDGQQHVAAVTVSASGRRLFIEAAADDVLHTNVAQYIFGDPY